MVSSSSPDSHAAAPEIDQENPSKSSPAAFAKARATRPEICGSYAPERPYPIYLRGIVERGFGRGGKDLGCPTANLPSKVIQSNPSMQRTGIYYGFARVLPQDPDDPDLVDENEALDSGAPNVSSGMPGSDANNADDDDVDVQTDEDGDEVVLSASPTYDGSDIDSASAVATLNEARSPGYFIKQRQLSKSSARSARSVKTILEKAGALNLDRTTSAGSSQGGAGTLSSSSSPLSPAATDATNKPDTASSSSSQQSHLLPTGSGASTRQNTITTTSSSSPSSGAPYPPTSADKHARDTSGTSSNASSMRRKKKRRIPIATQDAQVYPMVMSVGWNPFYKNTTRTAEVHILHGFKADFYGLEMRVVVLGYIRPEYNYVSKEALIDDIEMDKKVAVNSLARRAYQDYVTDPFLLAPS